MTRGLTLVLGGARSGKSSYAEQLARQHGGSVLYVATAEVWDAEMEARVAAHRAQRPSHWHTLEVPREIGPAIADYLEKNPQIDLVLVDCLTLLASNVVIALPEPQTLEAAEAAVQHEVDGLLAAYAAVGREVKWIVVSNEVGLGIVPAYALGRIYRDALGRANQRLAAAADRVLFMVAGLPMVVKG